jgi:hypothetical protein
MGKGAVRGLTGNRVLVLGSIAAVAAGVLSMVPATASSGSNTRGIPASGVTSFGSAGPGTGELQFPEFVQGETEDAAGGGTGNAPTLPVNRSQTNGNSGQGEAAGNSKKKSINPELVVSFNGLNHRQQRLANGGNQFSVEPPDQGLCAGNGFVLETVNDVMAVYDQAGNVLKGPVDLNTFYGYAAAINRSSGARGPFVTDPSCYFDVATQRWFHVVLTLEVFSNNGRFKGPNHLDLAVSQTSSPLGLWTIYRLPVQNDGTEGTPDHGCSPGPYPVTPTNPLACIGDYPHIGADANGFYITTNEYDFFGPNFQAAQIYAFSKQVLAANSASVSVTEIDTKRLVRGSQAGFTVWPASSPNGEFEAARDGTEYFLSSNAADEVNVVHNGTSNDLVVWALRNTASLNSSSPELSLANTVLTVGQYSVPPKSVQKVGDTPLRQCVNDTTMVTPFGLGCWQILFTAEPAHNEVESVLDSNDTRMQQVMFANGMLFGALDTALVVNGHVQAGIEWFAARPHLTANGVTAQLVNQGYVGAADTNLTYPALAVNENGVGVMAFTLVGTNDFPSAAYAPFSPKTGTGEIHIAAAGVGPADGFTSYKAFIGTPIRTRWGDYGAAVVDGSNIWMASEYIGQSCTFAQYANLAAFGSCGGTRTSSGNWGTRITEVSIGG